MMPSVFQESGLKPIASVMKVLLLHPLSGKGHVKVPISPATSELSLPLSTMFAMWNCTVDGTELVWGKF